AWPARGEGDDCGLRFVQELSARAAPETTEGIRMIAKPNASALSMTNPGVSPCRVKGGGPVQPWEQCSRRDLNPCQKLERLLSLATRLRERGDALRVESAQRLRGPAAQQPGENGPPQAP